MTGIYSFLYGTVMLFPDRMDLMERLVLNKFLETWTILMKTSSQTLQKVQLTKSHLMVLQIL